MSASPLAGALRDARLLVCVGTGGVGKTTIAAALALAGARLGRRTLVLTIDPARRLANAFGRDAVGAEPVRVALEPPAAGDAGAFEPFLEIMMLSTRHAFDQLVFRLTRDEATRRRILANRIYHHLAEALAGSSEYAAMAEVQALVESERYDLIVVDTPPAEHALDFLRAPGRLQAFLDSRFFHALVRPAMSASRFSLKLFAGPLHRALGLLERIAGIGFLEDLSDLLRALDGLAEGLASRARRVEAVLFGEETKFVLVCRALAGSERSTGDFMAGIALLGAPLAAVVVNRMHPWPLDEEPDRLLERAQGEDLAADLRTLAAALGPGGPRSTGGACAADPGRGASAPTGAGLPIGPDCDVQAEADARLIAEATLEDARICALERRRLHALAAAAEARGVGCIRITECSEPLDRLDGLLDIARQLTDES
ncbi:MAG: ArsA family ATPase [Deltaproteobacteria bacterium]|nr:ArsA family ATPase [Deltaproteobacteria bacterium]